MNRALLGTFVLGAIVAILSCDGSSPSRPDAGVDTTGCPIGTFRPVGANACVFAATDPSGNVLGVSDSRCASGQPAIPPTCVSDMGARAYWTLGTTCAPNYHFEPGACWRQNTSGVAGVGFDGTIGVAGTTGADGTTGVAGFFGGIDGVTGIAGTTGADGTTGVAGVFGGIAGTTGVDGTTGMAGSPAKDGGTKGMGGTSGSVDGSGADGAGGGTSKDASPH